jgi:hypothetical protein
MAREWLYRIYVEIPGNRVIADIVRAVVHAVLFYDHDTLRQHRPDSSVKGCLAALLQHRAGHAMTHLEWLRRPPRRRSLKTLRELFDKYQWLERLVDCRNRLPIPRSASKSTLGGCAGVVPKTFRSCHYFAKNSKRCALPQ